MHLQPTFPNAYSFIEEFCILITISPNRFTGGKIKNMSSFLLLGVSSDYAQPITGQITEVTCSVIGRAQPELTPSKRQKTGPGDKPLLNPMVTPFTDAYVRHKTSMI